MILTVMVSRQYRDWFDVEVPDNYPVVQLREVLGMRIFGQAPFEGSQYILEGKFPDGIWFALEGFQDVVEAGLREGCLLRVQRAFSTTTDAAPVFGKRSLFHFESNGVMEESKSQNVGLCAPDVNT